MDAEASEKNPWDFPSHYSPFRKADEHLARLKELDVGIELMLDDATLLWPDFEWETVLGMRDLLTEVGVSAQLHGPFHNLSLGARDEHIRHYSRELMFRGFQVARTVGSSFMVIHSGFLPQYSPATVEAWWRVFSEEFPKVLEEAQACGVMLLVENTYETDLTFFEQLFERFENPALGMCLDVGHAHCYSSVPVGQWAARFRSLIRHLHLSDNDGDNDRHWPLGKGTLKLAPVLEVFIHQPVRPSITLEVPFDTLDESLAVYRETCRQVIKEQAIS